MITVTDVLSVLRAYQMIAPDRLDELTRGQPDPALDPRELAGGLAARGWLTGFQVEKILTGRAAELRVGRHLILDWLGEGAMGQVFKARDQELGRVVAIKLVRPERLHHPDMLRRFHREARVIARLSHPNIVQLYDADESDGVCYFVMEFVDGEDLSRTLKRAGPFPVELAVECARQAAMGLQHAHARGLVHRDVKPSNLIRARADGGVKLLDLGLARLQADAEDGESTITQEGALLGTPDYLAPEQAEDARTVDIRADLYSLGCTLYHLATGQPPFPGGTLVQKIMKHQRTSPTAAHQVRPGLPPRLTEILDRMMAKRREDRYQTPAEVIAVLDEVFGGSGPGSSARTTVVPRVAETAVVHPGPSTVEHKATPGTTDEPGPGMAQPARLAWASESVFMGHADWVRGVAISPDGRFALTGGDDKVACLWSIQDREPVYRFEDHPAAVTSVAFFPDGNHVATGDARGEFRVRALPSGSLLGRHVCGHRVSSLAVTADGKFLVVGEGAETGELPTDPPGRATVWDWQAMKRDTPPRCHRLGVTGVALSPGGRYLLTASSDETICLWEVATGNRVSTMRGHTGPVMGVAFFPNGRMILSGGKDRTLRRWDAQTGEELSSWEAHNDIIRCVAITRSGRFMVSGGNDGLVKLWDSATGGLLETFRGHRHNVLSLAVSRDERFALSASADGTVRYWSLPPG